MSETPNEKVISVVACVVLIGYLFAVGIRMRAGHDMPRGFYRPHINKGPQFINNLADSYGGDVVGSVLIGIAVLGATLLTIWVWRWAKR